MEKLKVSVIVPVFNAEKYLDQCITSILNQSLQNIEIIIINDGSTDRSKDVILDYCKKDGRIIFIDSINKGVSAARNAGIKIAKGQYVGFVDADDYLDSQMYELLYENAENHKAEMVVANIFKIDNDLTTISRLQLIDEVIDIDKNKEAIINDFLRFKFDYANWNKIYSNELIQKNHIFFEETISMWEDILFNLIFIQYAKVVVTLKNCLYYYRVIDSSIVNDSKIKISRHYNLFYNYYSKFCSMNGLEGQLLLFKRNRCSTCIATIMLFIQTSTRTKLQFSTLYPKFSSELKELNPEIYLIKDSTSPFKGIQRFVLERKWFRIYSFFYVLGLTIKNRLRHLIKMKK
jgi:glycosyltransferase involved in cell wall biosynthesis